MLKPPVKIAERTAELLLEIGAMNLRPEEPYKLTAGWASPCYIDCRKIISYPSVRQEITQMTAQLLKERGVDADIMAGGETAGIPFAAWLADHCNKSMLYVRKKPKGFGRNAQIEGNPETGKSALLVEDLASDGGSKVSFVRVLRDAGLECNHTSVVFYYGVFPNSGEELKQMGVQLHYLTDWNTALQVIEKKKLFKDVNLNSVREFLDNPVAWSGRHGGLDHAPDRQIA